MTTVLVRRDAADGSSAFGPNDAGYPNARARITQIKDDGPGLTYRFPYAPVEVEFDSLGADYEEIERPGLYALVNRRAPKLLKATFEFRIAHKPTGGLESIQRDLEFLRRIATDDAPIAVIGLGSFFSDMTYTVSNRTNVLFRVYDLTIKVVRRGPSNEPWQADCKIDLVEDRNPVFTLASFAPITYTEVPVQTATSGRSSGNRGRTTGPKPEAAPVVRDFSKTKTGGGGGRVSVI